jgi:predicted nuclease with TOPRIM domain
MTLYAAFGGTPWVPGQDFGSWLEFMGVIQFITNILFGSVYVGVLYIAVVAVMFAVVALKVISPPDPDFVALRSDLKIALDTAKDAKADMQTLQGENKRLQEFLSERESSLTAVQAQLDAIKDETAERERALAQMQAKLADTGSSPEREEELLVTITQKDQTISDLQAEVAHLKIQVESAAAVPDADSKYRDYVRRAETAAQVSDSVISDLAELISQVESSSIDVAAQIALTTLIKSMGRAMGRVSEAAGGTAEPKIELIGAVMMAHEVVDAVKKLTRGS